MEYHLHNLIKQRLVISHDVIFEGSTPYYNPTDKVGQESRRYYPLEIQPWQQQLA